MRGDDPPHARSLGLTLNSFQIGSKALLQTLPGVVQFLQCIRLHDVDILTEAKRHADFFIADGGQIRRQSRIEGPPIMIRLTRDGDLEQPLGNRSPVPLTRATRMARPETCAVSPSVWASVGVAAWSFSSTRTFVTKTAGGQKILPRMNTDGRGFKGLKALQFA